MARSRTKSRKKKSKFKRHMYLHRQTYVIVGVVSAALVLVVWLANFLVKEEGKHKEVVKALTGTQEQRYQGALGLVAEGDIKQARVVMFRLARLGDSPDRPLGYGKAHLWVASDELTHFDPGFIWKFPGLDDRRSSHMA